MQCYISTIIKDTVSSVFLFCLLCVCRFLHQNLIKNIENIDHLKYLDTLNLSNNQITHLENLSKQ